MKLGEIFERRLVVRLSPNHRFDEFDALPKSCLQDKAFGEQHDRAKEGRSPPEYSAEAFFTAVQLPLPCVGFRRHGKRQEVVGMSFEETLDDCPGFRVASFVIGECGLLEFRHAKAGLNPG